MFIEGVSDLNKVEIINLLGQTVLIGASSKIDVSELSSGVYFLKVNNIFVTKVIKD